MARAYNVKYQLMTRFQRFMQVLAPSYQLVNDTLADGSPAVYINDSNGAPLGYAAIDPRSFSGFNIVAEISQSAGEGTPEHIFMLYFQTNAASIGYDVTGLITALAARIGCSSTQIYLNTTVPSSAVLIPANLKQDIPASAEDGASGA